MFRLLMLFLVLGFLSSCVEDDDQVTNEEIINLIILNDEGSEIEEAIGDGERFIVLRAQLPQEVGDDFKTVTFKSSEGNFLGTTELTTQERVNLEGIAEAVLELPLSSGELILTVQVGPAANLFKSEKRITLIAVDQVISLEFQDIDGENLNEIPRADGTSLIQLKGSILADQDNLTQVNFTATKGTFLNTGNTTEVKNTDANGDAVVNYIVPQEVGTVFYTAKTGTNGQYVSPPANLTFERAHANSLFVEPAQINMSTSASNNIKAFLSRSVGKVSVGTEVNYRATQFIDNETTDVGRFTGESNASTDMNEQVTGVNFLADTGDINLDFPVFITVSTLNDEGATLAVTISVNVTE